MEFLTADLSSQKSIRQLATDFPSRFPALHVLINNAGIASRKRQVSVDGIERTLAVNHLGYFLLTREGLQLGFSEMRLQF